MKIEDLLTPTAFSCLFTRAMTSTKDNRQEVGPIGMPVLEVRKLAAQLILEEAYETIRALGFSTKLNGLFVDEADLDIEPLKDGPTNVADIVDGCCDLIYVATQAILSCGVPDKPHLEAVFQANNAKFMNGEIVIDPKTGKYLKPAGWEGPNHDAVTATYTTFLGQDLLRGLFQEKLQKNDPAFRRVFCNTIIKRGTATPDEPATLDEVRTMKRGC